MSRPLPQPAIELLWSGLGASWMPEGYSAVCVDTPAGVVLAVGHDGGVVATERLHRTLYCTDAGQREGGPMAAHVAEAWLSLCARAWAHSRSDAHPTPQGART